MSDEPEFSFELPEDPNWEGPTFFEGQQLVLYNDGKEIVRDPKKELDDLMAGIERRYAATLDAASKWDLEDEELDQLPAREARVAREARKPKSEVAFGLQIAKDWHDARERRKESEKKNRGVNINIETMNAAVLPPMAAKPKIEDVIVIDAEALKAPEDT